MINLRYEFQEMGQTVDLAMQPSLICEKTQPNTHHITANIGPKSKQLMIHHTDGIYVKEFIMPTSDLCSLIYYLSFSLFINLWKSKINIDFLHSIFYLCFTPLLQEGGKTHLGPRKVLKIGAGKESCVIFTHLPVSVPNPLSSQYLSAISRTVLALPALALERDCI